MKSLRNALFDVLDLAMQFCLLFQSWALLFTGCPTSNLETLKAYILKSIWLKTKILGAMCVSWGYILFEIIKIFWKISKNGLSSKKLSEMALLVNSFQLKWINDVWYLWMIKESELRFCILFLEGNWAYNTNLFISIKNLEPKNAILSKGIFLANCVKIANFLIIWCPYSSRVGEPLSLSILKTTNFRLCVKQNVPTYDALSTKNFCSKSNTFWDISSQSFQIGSGTPCILFEYCQL